RFSEQLKETPDTVADASRKLRAFLLAGESDLLAEDTPERMFITYVLYALNDFLRVYAFAERRWGAQRAVQNALDIFGAVTRTAYDSETDAAKPRPIIGEITPRLTKSVTEILKPLLSDTLNEVYRGKVPDGLEGPLREAIEASLLTDWIPDYAPS